MADSRRAALGGRGEDATVAWYQRASYIVLDRNWRCRDGELDVVAQSADGGVLVFCEVKTRSSAMFGSPFEAVGPAKQHRVRRLASMWLQRTRRVGPLRAHPVRRGRRDEGPGGTLEVEVLQDAF
jgi:putative endonuclease